MRDEIIMALSRAERQQELWRLWRTQHPQTEVEFPLDTDYFPPEGHPYQQERVRNLKEMEEYYSQLKRCLETSENIPSIKVGTSTSLEIHLDDIMENQIVIELTVFGNITAVFVYGSIPDSVLWDITNCITSCGLIQLSESEIQELEKNNHYHQLF